MSSILFYTGGRCEPLGEHAVKAFENEELVTFLSTDIIGMTSTPRYTTLKAVTTPSGE